MIFIESRAEYEAFWPYRNSSHEPSRKPTVYPKRYPCLCSLETEGGGLMGEYQQVYVTYIPPRFTTAGEQAAFLSGVRAKPTRLG